LNPHFKVVITHAGETFTYQNQVFTSINAKDRECNYDAATLTCEDKNSVFYKLRISKRDDVKIYCKHSTESSYPSEPTFAGTVQQVNPSKANGKHLSVICKGYGAALENTHCNRDYGLESSNPTLDTIKEIAEDIVDNMVNKSFGTATNTGYALTKTKIANILSATSVKYMNNPFKTNMEVLDVLCHLSSAIGDGSTAGAHYKIDSSKNLILNTIGSHENPEVWPDYFNYTQADSTLTEATERTKTTFQTYMVLDKEEEYANKVVLITDFRRPAYDTWTENGFTNGYWDFDGTTCQDQAAGAGVPDPIVGSKYLDVENAFAWTPAASNAAWDITAWGSARTIPRLNFYMYKNDLVNANCQIILSTSSSIADLGDVTDDFYCSLSTLADPDDEWIFKSIPIGPYWATADETRKYRWSEEGSPDWANINALGFYAVDNGADPGFLCLDDLHFSGKIARSADNHTAYPTSTANPEVQRVLIARNSMDDSCIASDDTGFAGRICRSELLRRTAEPLTIMFTIEGQSKLRSGTKAHIHACKLPNNTFAIDTDMRLLTVEHDINTQGYLATVTATTDLLNSFPISVPDQYAMWMENMFLFSSEAKNVRAGAEVDLLIPMLSKSY